MTETTNHKHKPIATVCIYLDEDEVSSTWDAPDFNPEDLQMAREALLQLAEKLNEFNLQFFARKAYEKGMCAAYGEDEEFDLSSSPLDT